VVPILTGKLATDGEEAGRAFFARARAISLVALILTTAAGVALAGPLTEALAAGFHAHDGKFERTRALTQLVFPYVLFMGTAAMGAAALNAVRRFAIAAFAPALLNLGMIACALLLRAPLARYGLDPASSLGIGVLVGGALQVAVQLPALRRLGFLRRPVLDVLDPGVRDMVRRILPMTLGIGIYYVDLVVSRRFLSGLGDGAQSYFSWAMRICDFPQGIFVMAISTAALPSLSALAARGDLGELARTWAHGMRLSMFVAIPASVALVVLGEPIVRLLFQRGAFGPEDVRETARALAWQGGAIFTVAAVRQLVPALYALGDTRTPVIVSAVDSAVFLGMAIGLRRPFGHVGVSMAIGGSTVVQAGLLLWALRRRLGTLQARELGASSARIVLAAAIAALGGRAAAHLASFLVSGASGARALPGIVASVLFVVLYVGAAAAFGCRELDEVVAPIRRRLLGRIARAASTTLEET
jgi:putative peptidoglycan lipid II flippase